MLSAGEGPRETLKDSDDESSSAPRRDFERVWEGAGAREGKENAALLRSGPSSASGEAAAVCALRGARDGVGLIEGGVAKEGAGESAERGAGDPPKPGMRKGSDGSSVPSSNSSRRELGSLDAGGLIVEAASASESSSDVSGERRPVPRMSIARLPRTVSNSQGFSPPTSAYPSLQILA